MANEPSWEDLFSPPSQAEQPSPARGLYQDATAATPETATADDDPFAALFGGLNTGQTPTVSAPPVYDLQQSVQQPVQPVQPQVQQPVQPPSEYFSMPGPVPAAQPLNSESAPSDPFAGLFAAAAAPVASPVAAPAPAPVPLVAPPVVPPAGAPTSASLAPDPFASLFDGPHAGAGAVPTAQVEAPSSPTSGAGAPLTRRELREREALGASTAPAAPTAGAVGMFATTSALSSAAPVAAAAVPASPPLASGASQSDVFPFDFADSGRTGGGSGGGYGGSGGGYGGGDDRGGPTQPRKKRSLLWLKITLPIVIVLGLLGGAAAYVWLNYETQVRELLGWELPNDFEGTGNGEEVVVTIQSGDLGSDVANTLHDTGVTMTFDAFYELLLGQPENVNFLPGNYALQKEMSAQAALEALLDPANKLTSKLLITEGTTLPSALEIISETTSIPLADVQAAAEDPTAYGLPATEVSLEGWLFPATYELDGSEGAADILQLMVDTMIQHLDDAGVAPENRHTVLTLASIIQREAGSNQDDFYKIARVFQNRLDQGINLQSDATVAYGTGNLHTVWTTDEERADASNLFNTYANPGLPIGPIGLPGDLAIDAALHPADGPWLFFVPINLATGETVFSETAEEHEAAVEQLRAWCDESQENASYCE